MEKIQKKRLDNLLIEYNLAENKSRAQRLIMAGKVIVDDKIITKPGHFISQTATIKIKQGVQFVSRGGEKLEGAIKEFQLDIKDKICADIGASTGGFTDCLLQRGAKKVYAIDVGYGLLDSRLRNDSRVIVMEKINVRHLTKLPESPDIITIDLSFISLRLILPLIKSWFNKNSGDLIILIKPQFEAGRIEASRGKGIIHDPLVHQRILREILYFAEKENYGLRSLMPSPIIGKKGNQEFLAFLEFPKKISKSPEILVNEIFQNIS